MRAALACALALAVGLMAAAQGGGAYGAFANAPYSKASDFVDMLAAGTFYQASQHVADCARGTLSKDDLEAIWLDLLERYGRFQGREVTGADLDGDQWRVHVLCTFDKGRVDIVVSFSTYQDEDLVTAASFVDVKNGELR